MGYFAKDYVKDALESVGAEFTDKTVYLLANGDYGEHIEGYEFICQGGGGEGGTEHCEGVFKINDHYFKVEWRYYSYDGHDYSGAINTLKKVYPKQKTVTVYE